MKLVNLPPSIFPIPASTFYSAHVLPARPSFTLSAPSNELIKRSSFKKVTKFLQAAEKDGILKLKEHKGDVNVLGVNSTHPDVIAHKKFKSVGDVEQKEAKAMNAAIEAAKTPVMAVVELYKPHNQSLTFFEHIGKG